MSLFQKVKKNLNSLFNIKLDKWKSRIVYVALIVVLILYGMFDSDSAVKLIDALSKSFEILISGN